MELLVLLASARGRIVDRQRIFDALWPDTYVEERNLTQTVFLLRKALGDSTDSPTYVVTVPKRGYRFNGVFSPTGEAAGRIGAWKKHAMVAGAVALLTGCGMALYFWRATPPAAPSRLVVLPFVNMSPDPDTEYFSDGLTEELINALTRVQGLRVVARTTSFQFKGKTNDIRQIGKQLNVDAVLEGSVRKDGDRLRVTAQLNNAADGYHYWSQTFDRGIKDTFAVQEEIAQLVAGSLRKNGPTPPTSGRARSIEAHNHYLLGIHEGRKASGADLEKATLHFQAAIAKDPLFAEAHAELAQTIGRFGLSGRWPSSRAFPKSLQHARDALNIDPDLSEAHATVAQALLYFERDWVGAERAMLKAIQVNPNGSRAHHNYSHYLTVMGRKEDALRESIRARELDPWNMSLAAHRTWHHNIWGEYRESEAAAKAALEIYPSHRGLRFNLAEALRRLGRMEEAIGLECSMIASSKDASHLQQAFQKGGYKAYLLVKLRDALERNASGLRNPEEIARIYADLDDTPQALQWIRVAANERDPQIIHMRRSPVFARLRKDPTFLAITAELGLP